MKSLPQTNSTLLIRTDFSDQAAWQALHTAVATPNEDDFLADVHVVDDSAYRDLTIEQVISLAPAGRSSLMIVADKTALTTPEMPLLAVHLPYEDEPEQDHEELRVTAEELWSIENNISLANMDWEEFVEAADDDGVFRGF
ncbi:hypothetical protein SAMN04490357_1561 [Streptomyces misionensis]|uniref:DUF6924 domain-containing protein n=1 Tax=Streptomyces misionensis TaxID=67331 RepID=A0A1H4R113_9ACTN|nr:hypothetical protein [Streptomyces misionensis]SEC25457.1 hypothetical protein SAMN04490357_1561 [Streptomyces misionensis]